MVVRSLSIKKKNRQQPFKKYFKAKIKRKHSTKNEKFVVQLLS